jgi:hypothetical protein
MVCMGLHGCKEDVNGLLSKDGNNPGTLRNTKVENLPGAAKITYALPDDLDLLYVEAVFSYKGVENTVRSSLYKNFVLLEGFVDTNPHEVKLLAVTKADKRSEPITVTIQPLTSPLVTVYESLKIKEDFGGINMSFENKAGAEYIYHTMIKNANGEWVEYDRLYSKAEARSYSVRGLPSIDTEFGFYVTDRWKNNSDILKVNLVPLYEEKLDKKLWKPVYLSNDTYMPHYPERPISKIWDDAFGDPYFFIGKLPSPTVLPHWFTFDLGKTMKLSRMKFYQYVHTNIPFGSTNVKQFELWGTAEIPAQNGSWDQWKLLLEGESIKPSGSALGTFTAEDLQYAVAGEDYVFSLDALPVRYLRFKSIRTWGGTDNIGIAEITIWGQDNK